jgi:amylosucrase
LRKKQGTIEHTLFTALKKMIAIRKEITAFADFNNRHLIDTNNEHLFAFMRFDHNRPSERVLVVSNFSAEAQSLDLQTLAQEGFGNSVELTDLYSGKRPAIEEDRLIVQPFHFYWLNES